MNPLDELIWRDEVLQALYWMHGEGLAESATVAELARFLAADQSTLNVVLVRMAGAGYLTVDDRANPDGGPAYRLSALGREEGGRRFRDEFAGLTRQAHGECGPGCWCHDPEREGEPCPNPPEEEPEHARA